MYTATIASLVILTYNRGKELVENLNNLIPQLLNYVEIIVIDNHSLDDTQILLKSKYQQIKYIRTDMNLGTAARNLGLAAASHEYVITLDDDIIGLTLNDVYNLISILNNNSSIGAINFKITNFYTKRLCNWVHHCDPDKYSEKAFSTYEITEGAVVFRKSMFINIGGYYNNYFISHEGPDLAFRIIDSGYDVIYNPVVEVMHKHSVMGRTNWLNYYYDTRNIFMLVIRHLPFTYGTSVLIKGLIAMLIYSIRDGYIIYWCKGVVDGIKCCKEAFETRKKLSNTSMIKIHNINKNRPRLGYYIKNRLMRNGCRL
jgi:GT2 family glycosyltransferase